MSQANKQIGEQLVEAFNSRSFELLSGLTSEDFEFVPYMASTLAKSSYRGLEGLHQYFADADAAWQDIRVHIDSVRDTDNGFVAFGGINARGRSSGVETEVLLAWVVEVERGLVIRLRSYGDAAQALAAAGLSEAR